MKNITKQIDSKIASDLIILLIFAIGMVVYLQYSSEIHSQISEMMYHPLQDLKNSIAELDSPSR